MAVKEKAEVQGSSEHDWNVDSELQLFQILCSNKPVGINRYFQMACIVEKLASALNKDVTAATVWEHLSTMFDLDALNDSESLPFPMDETDFSLPQKEFEDLILQKESEVNVKPSKGIKKEEKKETTPTGGKTKTVESTPASSKAAQKRTRTSTASATPTTATSSKRRRI